MRLAAAGILAALVITTHALDGQSRYRTLDDRFAPPQYSSPDAWNARAAYLREELCG